MHATDSEGNKLLRGARHGDYPRSTRRDPCDAKLSGSNAFALGSCFDSSDQFEVMVHILFDQEYWWAVSKPINTHGILYEPLVGNAEVWRGSLGNREDLAFQ
jgi:hypothetical protein